MNDRKEALEGEFPTEFLETYGPALHTAVAVLGEMAATGDVESIRHTANLFRLMVNAAAKVALEVQKKKAENDFRPGWILN